MSSNIIIGIDEAGRGALVGPVYAGCCYVPDDFDLTILKDSKALTAKEREVARNKIIASCVYGIGFADEREIDDINILQATFLAMKRAFENFLKMADEQKLKLDGAKIIVDGNRFPPFLEKYRQNSLFYENENFIAETKVKADGSIHSVMAASILAKTARDEFMLEMDKKYPQYNYKSHKGYGTKEHMELIKKYGLSPIARKTFKLK